MKQLVAAAIGSAVILGGGAAFAESVEGRVIAYDRVAHRLVLNDKTVFSLAAKPDVAPAELSAGDVIRIEFTSPGEDGIASVDAISIIDDED